MTMGFVSPLARPSQEARWSKRVCPLRMTGNTDGNQVPKPVVRNDGPVTGRKLVRNLPDAGDTSATGSETSMYAEAAAGDMVNAPKVGEGMGPRRGVKEKKVTRAAAIQKSQSFADAWAEQNQGRVDVWLIIGAITLLTPLIILAWAVATGIIPTGGLFDD